MYTGWKVFSAVLNFSAVVVLINKLGWTGLGLSLLINLSNAIRVTVQEMEEQRIKDLERLARIKG